MKKNEKLFVVSPAYDGDIVYVVGKCKKSISAFDAYQTDKYEEMLRTDSLEDSKKYCRKLGVKQPKVI